MAKFPSFDLIGKTALVTGAGKGLGRACALALAHAGADIALGLRQQVDAGDLEADIVKMGRKCIRLQMDVTEMSQIAASVDQTAKHFGKVDILLNNVGIAPENPVEKVTEEDFDLTLRANLKGTFFTSQAVGRIMIKQGGGKIINMSSQAGFVALKTESIYCMTKAAINHLTRCLAVEWAKYNITVNAVAPTFIYTPGTEPALKDKVFHDKVVRRIPLGRIGDPEDVTGAVVFLASEGSNLITGDVMLIDGGWTAQ